eukprot:gene17931-biopygen4662
MQVSAGAFAASRHHSRTWGRCGLPPRNSSIEPLVIIGCAGGTDALSGTASFLSNWPVVSCPPDGDNESCLRNPPGSSNAY